MDNRNCANKATTILNELFRAGATNTNCPDSSTALVEAPAKLFKLMLDCPLIDVNQPRVRRIHLQKFNAIQSLSYPKPQIHALLETEVWEKNTGATTNPYERLQMMLEHPRVDINQIDRVNIDELDHEGHTVFARIVLYYPHLIPLILNAADQRDSTAIPLNVNSILSPRGTALDVAERELHLAKTGGDTNDQTFWNKIVKRLRQRGAVRTSELAELGE